MKKKPKTGILQRFFKIICLAVTLTSAGFLIYHMVYLPMENKKLVAELKGNFPELEAPGASGTRIQNFFLCCRMYGISFYGRIL